MARAPATEAQAPTSTGPVLTRRSGYSYERRRPETTTLYAVIRDNLETLYAAVEDGFASAPLPKFVRDELEGYLDCGVLCRGAALLVCEDCAETKVIALSCKGRGFCPSCLGRRMAQTAANLVDHVIPQGVALRQWVLTFPFELRARLAFDAKLLSAVCGVFNDVLLSFYERALGDRVGDDDDNARGRRRKLQSGTVTVVQRVSSDLRLNPHLHVVALDGVFYEQPNGPPRFVQLPELDSLAVAELITTVRIRLLRLLERRGVIESANEPALLPPDETEHEHEHDPVLAQLSAASVSGLVPAGPERRQRPALGLVRPPGASVLGPLCAADSGFTLHAATVARRDDPAGKEALLRYVLRPSLAQERVEMLDDGLVRLTLNERQDVLS